MASGACGARQSLFLHREGIHVSGPPSPGTFLAETAWKDWLVGGVWKCGGGKNKKIKIKGATGVGIARNMITNTIKVTSDFFDSEGCRVIAVRTAFRSSTFRAFVFAWSHSPSAAIAPALALYALHSWLHPLP